MRLRDRGGHGASERGLVVEQEIIACGHSGVDPRLQVPQVAQRADDPPTDLLEYRGNVRIVGRLDRDKARREALVSTIKVGSLKNNHMEMEVQTGPVTTTSNIVKG